MGQRSQIYIVYEGKLIVANYYQWNFAERMISRTRSILEHLDSMLEYKYKFKDEYEIETIRRYCDINFDYEDMVRSLDIFDEWVRLSENGWTDDINKNDFFFEDQDNNDGQLFISIKNGQIKYALRTPSYSALHNYSGVLSASEYWQLYAASYADDDIATIIADENIPRIEDNYQLMTDDELNEIVLSEDPEMFYRIEIKIKNNTVIKCGHWIQHDDWYECSNCGCNAASSDDNYCRWCGSDNRGVIENG